jgi:hypothetical protein
MLGDPERPLCPLCERPTMILIATMTGERAMDIFLCPQCRTEFSYEHPKAKGATPDLQPVPKVQAVTSPKCRLSQMRKAVREPCELTCRSMHTGRNMHI